MKRSLNASALLGAAEVRLGIGTAALAIAPGLAGVLAARTLGAAGRGELAVAVALASVAGALGMRGLDVAILAASSETIDEHGLRSVAFRRAVSVAIGEGLLAGVVVALVLGSLDLLLLLLTGAMASLTTMFLLLRALNLSAERTDVVMRSDLASAATMVVAAIFVASLALPAAGYVASAVLGLAVGSGVAMRPLAHVSVLPGDRVDPLSDQLRHVGRAAWVARGFQSAAFRLDRVVLAGLAGAGAAGVYAAVVPFAEMTTIVQLHLAQLATVRLARSGGTTRWHELREFRIAMVLSTALGVATIVLAEPLIDLVYGSEFADGVSALRILAVASVVSVAWRFAEAELFARQSPRGVTFGTAAAAAVVLGGTALLSGLEADGASLASLAGYAAGLVLVVLFSRSDRNA